MDYRQFKFNNCDMNAKMKKNKAMLIVALLISMFMPDVTPAAKYDSSFSCRCIYDSLPTARMFERPYYYRMIGKVIDSSTQKPIANVRIVICTTSRPDSVICYNARSNERGIFVFELPNDCYSLKCIRADFQDVLRYFCTSTLLYDTTFIAMRRSSRNSVEEYVQVPSFELRQCYPNPSNNIVLTINYILRDCTHVKLTVASIVGQYMTTIVDSYQIAGEYHVDFNCIGLPAGTYFYRIVTNDGQCVRTLILKP